MPIQFTCPHCGVQTQVADHFAGHAGPCRQCGQAVTVPYPDAPPVPDVQMPRAQGVACPRCGSHSHRAGPWPWYLGTIGAIFVSAKVCNACGHHFDGRKPQADFTKRKRTLAILINGFGGLGIVIVFVLLGILVYATMR